MKLRPHICPECKGRGRTSHLNGDGLMGDHWRTCHTCGGAGEVEAPRRHFTNPKYTTPTDRKVDGEE